MKQFTVLLLAALHCTASQGEPDQDSRYSLREQYESSTTAGRLLLSRGAPYPLDRKYSAFTADQKARLRELYVDMKEDDEPPFPFFGMRGIIESMSYLHGELRKNGTLMILVYVDATGTATSVKLLEYPDIDFAKAAAAILVRSKYKPAICAGVPCEMAFPFCFSFK